MSRYTEPNYDIDRDVTTGVLHVIINRPRKLNAYDDAMWQSLKRLMDTASDDTDVRCVVVSSALDRAFCSGLDLSGNSLVSMVSEAGDAARAAHNLQRHIRDFQDAISSLSVSRKPVILCANGISFGLAVDLATAADIRLCSQDTRWAVKEVDVGLAADIGTLQRLPKCVGSGSWAREVCLTAREFGADEALRQGLVSAVYPTRTACVEAGLQMAKLIATKSPIAVQATKLLMEYSRDRTVAEGLLVTQLWNASQLQASDVPEAMTATMAKRKPAFSKL
ncbi:hypothetical protein PYCC9005_001489 [Savitreella phatthalungensis]